MDFQVLLKKNESLFDYADIRAQTYTTDITKLNNQEVEALNKNEGYSYGIRVLINGSTGFAHSTKLNDAEGVLKQAIKNAKLLKQGVKINTPGEKISDKIIIKPQINPFDIDYKDKIGFLKEVISSLRKEDLIKNATATLIFTKENNEFITINKKISQEFIQTAFVCEATARKLNEIEHARKTLGAFKGYEALKEIDEEFLKSLKDEVITNLNAKHAPVGRMPIVCDQALTGVFFHEAIGHACEADSIINKSSVFINKKDQKIGSELVTLYDDPTMDTWGRYTYDDEGIKAKRVPMFNEGVLSGFLHSLETASIMNEEPTGNGRAQDPSSLPLPRMSNTVLKPGTSTKEEMIKGVKKGIYALGFSGGVVEPVTGQFSFKAERAYLIENGEITTPLKEVTLSGNILQTIKLINAVGNDPRDAKQASYCGKSGQHVNVADISPHIRISEIIVGGRV